MEKASKVDAIRIYQFACAELEAGLNYGVDKDLYDKSMEAIGSTLRCNGETVTLREFADHFWKEYQKYHAQK